MGRAQGGAAGEPLQVADRTQAAAQGRPGGGIVDERRHCLLPRGDGHRIAQGPEQPLAEEARSHRGDGGVEHPEE